MLFSGILYLFSYYLLFSHRWHLHRPNGWKWICAVLFEHFLRVEFVYLTVYMQNFLPYISRHATVCSLSVKFKSNCEKDRENEKEKFILITVQKICSWLAENYIKNEIMGSSFYFSTLCTSAFTSSEPCEEVNMHQHLINSLWTINI